MNLGVANFSRFYDSKCKRVKAHGLTGRKNKIRGIITLTMIWLVLTIVNFTKGYGQTTQGFDKLGIYKKWGVVACPVLYNRAVLEPQYGTYTFKNKPIPSYVAGVEYDFFLAKKFSFVTGGLITLEPIYNIRYIIKKEDIYSNFNGDTDNVKAYAMHSFSIPLYLRYRTQVTDNLFWNFITGFKAMYFPNGEAYMSIIYHNEDDTESREVFGLRVESSEDPFYGSFVVGTGASYTLKRILLSAKLIYVVNFKNLMEGEYLFDNMFVSPRSYGYYKLSGNYVGLLFSVNLPKRKKQKIVD